MDSESRKNAHIPPPMIRQPVDSYHRLIRETHGVEGDPGPSSRSRSDSRRFISSRPDTGADSQFGNGNVASFFDSERLASSSAQYNRDSYASPTGSKTVRWPFLGSIRSRASRSFPSSPQAESPTGGPVEIQLPWRPFFLYRRVLLLFAIVFVALIGGVQASLQLSERNDGLREVDDVSRYLWQYGTTLVFILVAAFWTRVEYQASAAMPWISLLNNQVEVDKSLMLDYVSLFEPMAIFKAVRNKDWLVASPVLVGLLFKVVVIFSTAFITPRVVTVASHESSITVQAAFSDSLDGLQDVTSLPYFVMASLQTDNATYPNGVSPRAAYTPFVSNRTEFVEIRAVVDGFIGGMECTQAELTLDSMRFRGGTSIQLNMTVSENDCSSNQTLTSTRFASTDNEDLPRTFLSFQAGSCGRSTADDQRRIVVMAGILDLDMDKLKKQSKSSNGRVEGKISTSVAFSCKPNYSITQVRVSKSPEEVLATTPVQGATNTTLDKIHPWAVAQALFQTFKTDTTTAARLFASSSRSYNSEAVLVADEAMSAALAMRAKEEGAFPKLESLTDGDTLKQLAEDFYTQYSALVSRYAMMEPISNPTTAVASYVERRLIVRAVPAYLMTGFLALCLLLTLTTMYLAPNTGFLPRDPNTIVGLASVVAHSHPFVECLRGMGAANKEAIKARLAGSSYSSGAEGHEKLEDPNQGFYHIFGGKAPPRGTAQRRFDSSTWRQPVMIHGLIRLLYIVILASIIIGFEVSLRASQRYNGLRTMDNDAAYLAWTVVPALVLLVVAMYMITLEWWTRLLAPFSHLARQGDFGETVGLNLADALRHVAFRRAWKIGDFGAVTAITGGFIALLVVVASAPLFEPMRLELDTSLALRTEDYFANSLASSPDDPICTDCTNDTTTASLILAGRAPYPPFTYADLNFPTISLGDEGDSSDDLRISVRLTAIRPNMTCRLYLSDEITTNLTLEYKLDDKIVNPLRIDLEGETCRGSKERDSSNAIIGTTRTALSSPVQEINEDSTLFGVGQRKTNSTGQCSDWLYVWGRLVDMDTDDMSVSSIGALACNETIQALDADVILHGPELHLYPDTPPTLFESTAFNTTVAIPRLDYSNLVNVSSNALFDPFFATLNASWLAVSESVLGGSSASDANQVRSAILLQHGIIRAQSLNLKSRRHLSQRGTFPSADGQNIISGVDPNAPVSQAVPIISGSKLSEKIRLRQDPTATRILQGLVGALLLLHILSWILTRRLRLPRPPTTIASTAALIVDGNMLKLLPRGAQWQPMNELENAFGDEAQFELGWDGGRSRPRRDRRKRKEEGYFGIRATVTEDHIPEELELRPIPPRPDRLRPMDRVGTVSRGTARLGEDSTQRKSVLVGKESPPTSGSKDSNGAPRPRKKRSLTAWSGPKEMVKVWWASAQ
ncbi:hypothetical protein CEP52_013040 [Fusarium oligoseptatum]|uniref:Uncharacterized protein n=1 Tax=Fusarium oligoseptatum TaxID=2604345 RepID=A0A428SVG7_9HYPO|nr:hypothetical protein CEP52_013040 [Fusarium oligoseptatum]